jgi:HSP20 family protein
MNNTTDKAVVKAEKGNKELVAADVARLECVPLVAIRKEGDGFVVVAELPGVDEKGLKVTVEDVTLVLEAQNDVSEPQGYRPVLREIAPVVYRAVFSLPDRVDTTRVKATLRNGLLRVALPSREERKPRRIEIAAA